ncbi:UNVERIFIED_ORG: DNA-binding ferritin-like protein (Dps family) [Bacillus sp. 1751]|nr:DNA-binding ferritin-like protein (Dps family) [Bacillus sp. 1751]
MFKKMIGEKREYRVYKERVNQLPEEYKKAMKAIESYMWNFAKGAGMLELLKNILEMFENSASDGLNVRDVVGNDIAEFADSFLAEFPEETWIDKLRNKLRESIK